LLPQKQQQPADGQASAPSSTTRSILNCEVDFGAGASIQQIITPFESSQIILSNLLRSVTKADLTSLVDRLVGLVEFTVFESTGIARIRFENCDQAARAVQHLDGRVYHSVKLAARLDLRVAIESGSGILLSRKLKLSWFTPSRIAWAHYSNIQRAKEEAQRLDGKTFNGHKLAVSFQATSTSTRYRVTRISSSIEIKGLPLRINEDHLKRFTRSSSIAIGDPSYSQEEASQKIRALLSEFGSLDSFDLLPSDNKKPKTAAFAQFSSSESAADAAKALNNMPQEFLRYSRLWAEQIHCIKYNISPRQFTTLKEELDRLRAVHGMIAKLRLYDRDEHGAPVSPVCIRIYGSDPKALGRLKGEVEALLRGETLMLADGSDLWDDYFETEDGQRFIDALNADLTCFVKCDTRTRAIRLSGNNNARERLKVSLVRQLDAVKAKRHVVSLEQEKLRALLTGGLKLLETEMGAEKVVLDVVARTITVRGDEGDVGKVCRTIAAMDSASPAVRAQTASLTQALCPVCFCDVSDPIKLPCGHSYCLTCMQHLLRARTGSSSSFSLLTCVAQKADTERESAATSCSVYIPYPIIRQLLQPAEESALLRAAFHSHLHARPGEFRYCPTPDCPVIYRHRGEDEDSGRVLQCPACIARICARCHVEFHEGLTCAEHIYNQSGGMQALQKWKEEHGVKPCPECGVDLEKADGCNHITCIHCKTHMCWECMATFGTSGAHIYDHMNRAHGGIGITFDD
jgi:RNA recognition motif-containing protein